MAYSKIFDPQKEAEKKRKAYADAQANTRAQTQMTDLNTGTSEALRNAYIAYEQARKNAPETLARTGYTGGLSESSIIGMGNNFSTNQGNINVAKVKGLADIRNTYNTNVASNQSAYDTNMAGIDTNQANYDANALIASQDAQRAYALAMQKANAPVAPKAAVAVKYTQPQYDEALLRYENGSPQDKATAVEIIKSYTGYYPAGYNPNPTNTAYQTQTAQPTQAVKPKQASAYQTPTAFMAQKSIPDVGANQILGELYKKAKNADDFYNQYLVYYNQGQISLAQYDAFVNKINNGG